MSLSNLFSNEVNNFINKNDKENVIKCHLNKNITNFYLSAIKKNRVGDQSEVKKKDTKKIKVISHSKIK